MASVKRYLADSKCGTFDGDYVLASDHDELVMIALKEKTKLQAENEKLRGELEKVTHQHRLEVADSCGTDDLIRTLAKKVLPASEVDGDSYGVPGVPEVMEMVVNQNEKLRECVREYYQLTNAHYLPCKGYDCNICNLQAKANIILGMAGEEGK